MVNNPCTGNCHKISMRIDESTWMCPWGYESTGLGTLCLYMDIFILMYMLDRKFLLIDEPIWKGHTGNTGNMNCVSITRKLIT